MSNALYLNDEEDELPLPQANPHFAGHDSLQSFVVDYFKKGRFPHAWLLVGEKGIGKATFAYRMARFILFLAEQKREENQVEDDLSIPFNSLTFQRVAAQTHPNMMVLKREIDAKTGRLKQNIAVEEVRKVSSFLHMTPAENGWRVIIVDSADDFNRNSANSILKLLEEPPERTVFFLISHQSGGLLPTIRSRCNLLQFSPLSKQTLEGLLSRYRPDLPPEDRQILISLSEGSIGRALSLAESDGAGIYSLFMKFMAENPQPSQTSLNNLCDKIVSDKSGEVFSHFSILLTGWLMRLVRCKASQEVYDAIIPEEKSVAQKMLQKHSLEYLMELWETTKSSFAMTEQAKLDQKHALLCILSKIAFS